MSEKFKSLQTLDELLQHDFIKPDDLSALETVIDHFSFKIPAHMQSLIDKTNPNDPIARQFIPTTQELNVTESELRDPIGDEPFTPVKGITHRYKDRCLLTPVHVCPVYCRFCFRKQKVGSAAETLTPQELATAYAYIKNHEDIWEVIITGGDPLILKPATLKTILTSISQIHHVEVIRLHTRVPVIEPQRIGTEMISALKCGKPVYVALHANHAKEFTPEATKACAHLIDSGIPMLSQTTLLKNLNDNIDALSELMRCLIKNRIKPYYLHHCDLAKGTQHFRTTIEEGQALVKQLRGRFSGLCQPTYVLDIPGGFGKVPIGPNYLNKGEEGYCIEDHQGNFHTYGS
jgi:lysine 2,3-aminomutase